MGSLLQNGGNVNMATTAAIAQLQADVATINNTLADVRQIVALWPAAFGGIEDQVKHVIDQNDRIVALIADPNDPDAGVAALAGISKLLELSEAHTTWLRQLEAAQAGMASRMDVFVHELAAHDTHVQKRVDAAGEAVRADVLIMGRRQIVLAVAMAALALLMVLHSYEVAQRLDAAFVSVVSFLVGMFLRGGRG